MGLAGAKRKQRISVDPQNQSWSQDTEKFGYKMLMKMGWSEGKGLGAKEDGATDQIAPNFKDDTKGLGVQKASLITETYQQLSAFDSLLQQANSSDGEKRKKDKKNKDKKDKKKKSSTTSTNSSTDKRVEVGGRLAHRKKFIKNKSVDQYSEQHLKEILGTAHVK